MRPEVPFVLEYASWPAFLVEETGTIRRANAPALELFGKNLNSGRDLASIWSSSNPTSAQEFCAKHRSGPQSPHLCRYAVKAGSEAGFQTCVVVLLRGDTEYLLFQLLSPSEVKDGRPATVPPAAPVTPKLPQMAAGSSPAPPAPPPVVAPAPSVPPAPPQTASAPAAPPHLPPALPQAAPALPQVVPASLHLTPDPLPAAPPSAPPQAASALPHTGAPQLDAIPVLKMAPPEVPPMTPPLKVLATTSPVTAHTPVLGQPDVPVGSVDAGLAHKQKLECALQLTRTVVLDFNNALTSILGHTSLVLSKMEPGNPWRNSLLEVEKSAERAAEIVHDLATFSRQERDQREQPTGNLNDLIYRTVELFKNPANAAITWVLGLESHVYAVKFDEAKIQQAFVKIIENALQAVKGRGRIAIATHNRTLETPLQDSTVHLPAGHYVLTEVSDNGEGIAAEVLPRIFEPFFTTRGGEGHRGLGLAWVYGIVTNHGGNVAVSSQPGRGTSVRVYLPAQKKLVRERHFKSDELTGTQTILMVDDESLVLSMGQTILSAYGYTVLTASGGEQALEVFAEHRNKIALVITDLVMPRMSGRELVEKLRAIAPHLRIICSSGYVRSSAPEDELGYLKKPFTSQELLRKVKQALTSEGPSAPA